MKPLILALLLSECAGGGKVGRGKLQSLEVDLMRVEIADLRAEIMQLQAGVARNERLARDLQQVLSQDHGKPGRELLAPERLERELAHLSDETIIEPVDEDPDAELILLAPHF